MKVTLNKPDDVNGVISMSIEKPDYQDKVEKSLSQYRQQANIPGFRQGKVPKTVIRKMFGKSIIADEINKLMSEELEKFIQDNNLKILGQPLLSENSKTIDFDTDEEFEFNFDVALTPEFEVAINENDELSYNIVKLEDELLEQQLNAYKQNYGKYLKVEESAKDTDLIKGELTELENGEPKADGIVIDNAILMPSYLKDEETKNKFIGSNANDLIVFNPRQAYDNNEAELASLLQTTKEKVADMNSDFEFNIKEITRYQEAEMDQELFDKVLGENAVTSEEEFKNKIEEILSGQFKPAANNLFMKEARDMFVKKMESVEFPDAFLKRWLITSNEKYKENPESLENEYPAFLEDLKYYVVKEKIAEKNEIKVESADIEALAAEVAKSQFAQYGMTNLPADVLQNYVHSLLSKEETVRNMYDRVMEDKIGEWLRQNIKVNEVEIASKDFNKILEESAHVHEDEHDHDHDHEETTDVKDSQEEN